MTLYDFHRSEAILDFFDTAEAAAVGIPAPWREMHPAVAGDRKREIDPPRQVQNRLMLGVEGQAASRACNRSAMMSSGCSIPTERRT